MLPRLTRVGLCAPRGVRFQGQDRRRARRDRRPHAAATLDDVPPECSRRSAHPTRDVTGVAPMGSVGNREACGAPRHLGTSSHGGSAVRARRAQTISPPAPRGWRSQMVRYWLPPLMWMAGMSWLSTDTFAAERTGGLLWRTLSVLAPRVTDAQYTLLHFFLRKSAHGTEYAILAFLLLRAFRGGVAEAWHWRWATLSFLMIAAHALLDEYHQSFTQYRTGSVYDSVIDMSGGLAALVLLWLRRRRWAVPLAGRERGQEHGPANGP